MRRRSPVHRQVGRAQLRQVHVQLGQWNVLVRHGPLYLRAVGVRRDQRLRRWVRRDQLCHRAR